MPHPLRIAIVGGGFTGTALAAALGRGGPVDIALYEPRALARGVAYGTNEPAHLLNVPAAAMSAVADDPGHFERWLADRGLGGPHPWFAPRQTYGAYLTDVLAGVTRPGVRLDIVPEEVLSVDRDGGVVTRSGKRSFDRVVLAIGHFAPTWPSSPAGRLGDRCLPTPWGGLDRIGPDDDVLVLGSGLTMVDVALSLDARGHRGALLAVSRHGLLPLGHAPTKPWPWVPEPVPDARGLLRQIRAQIALAAAEGADWRGVLDGMRPKNPELWGALPPAERARFLRHVRAWWDVHRHRMAPDVAARITTLRDSGRLDVLAGRVTSLRVEVGLPVVTLQPRGTSDSVELRASWLVNATGPTMDWRRVPDALPMQLLADGLVCSDALGLGIEVAADGAAIGSDGLPSSFLYAAGPATRPRWGEITAVPELRTRAAALADRLRAPVPAILGSGGDVVHPVGGARVQRPRDADQRSRAGDHGSADLARLR